MKLSTMALIFAGVLVVLVVILSALKAKSKNPKIQRTPKEKKQRTARFAGLFIIGGTGLADFFLFNKVGIAILIGVSLVITVLAITLIQTAGGGIQTFFTKATTPKPKGPYIDDEGVYHGDPNYKFDPSTEPIIGFNKRDWDEDESGNLGYYDDEGDFVIVSPETNTDTSYQKDPRRMI